jgi:hypothetical protein
VLRLQAARDAEDRDRKEPDGEFRAPASPPPRRPSSPSQASRRA